MAFMGGSPRVTRCIDQVSVLPHINADIARVPVSRVLI